MSLLLSHVSNFVAYFQLYARRLTSEEIMEAISLLEQLKRLLEVVLPRAIARNELVQQRQQQAVQSKQEGIDKWMKKTEKKARVLKISELCQPCEGECAICLETHAKNTAVVLGCKHEFGRECFTKMVENRMSSSHREVRCPMCRVEVKTFCGYRRREAPKPRNPVAAN